MPAKTVYLVYDLREPGHPGGPKLTKAAHSSLAAAREQAELDLAHGRHVVRIEDGKGTVVWEP
jgi:hypothetical protein